MTSNLPWQPSEVDELQGLWQDLNLTASRIGDLLGRPRNSVIGRVNRMRSKEGEERWPRRASHPPLRARKLPEPKPKKTKEPKAAEPKLKAIKPILPDQVTVGHTDRCFWTGCDKAKKRGNYCSGHAEIMYIPRRA